MHFVSLVLVQFFWMISVSFHVLCIFIALLQGKDRNNKDTALIELTLV